MSCRHILLIIFIVIISLACSASFRQLKPYGDKATMRVNSNIRSFELLAIDQTGLLVISPDDHYERTTSSPAKIYRIPKEQISDIKIEGYSNKNWILPVIIFQVIPAILLIIAASSAGAEMSAAGYAILLGPPALTLILFSSSTPADPAYHNPLDAQKLKDLKKYTRYPQGLSEKQLSFLLRAHDQEQPWTLE